MRKNYEINLTYTCNWNCSYCCVDTHNKNISFTKVKELLKIIEPNSTVSLSGGEVGTLPKYKIEYVIKQLIIKNCDISLNTNGLFLNKYPELIKYFDEILYHCSENLDNSITLNKKLLELYNKNILKLLLVIDNNGLKKLNTFDFKYTYDIIPATNSTGKNMSKLDKKLYPKLLKYKKYMIKESYKKLIKNTRYDDIVYLDENTLTENNRG